MKQTLTIFFLLFVCIMSVVARNRPRIISSEYSDTTQMYHGQRIPNVYTVAPWRTGKAESTTASSLAVHVPPSRKAVTPFIPTLMLDSVVYSSSTNEKRKFHVTPNGRDREWSIIGSQLDTETMLWTQSAQYDVTYDSNNQLLKEVYIWNGINAEEKIYTYDENLNVTSYLFSQWNFDSVKLIDIKRDEYTYDSRNNLASYKSFDKNRLENKWVLTIHYKYTYDDNNNLLSHAYFSGDTFIRYGEINTYDRESNLLSTLTSYWLNSVLVTTKQTYTYDLKNNLLSQTTAFHYSSSPGKWEFGNRIIYEYDDDNNQRLSTTCVWDEPSQSWLTVGKNESTYDNNHNRLSWTSIDFDQGNNNWVNHIKYEYRYENNQLTEMIESYRNESSNAFENTYKCVWTYDNRYSMGDLEPYAEAMLELANYEDANITDNVPISRSIYYWRGVDWQHRTTFQFYYSETGNSFTPRTDALCIVPNPVETLLWIDQLKETASISLYDTRGRVRQTGWLAPRAALFVGHLESGLYILHVKIKKGSYKLKFIKK